MQYAKVLQVAPAMAIFNTRNSCSRKNIAIHPERSALMMVASTITITTKTAAIACILGKEMQETTETETDTETETETEA